MAYKYNETEHTIGSLEDMDLSELNELYNDIAYFSGGPMKKFTSKTDALRHAWKALKKNGVKQ